MNRLVAWICKKIMCRRGYSPYFANMLLEEISSDLFENKNTTFSQKLWAFKRGFFSTNIKLYGLNDRNYVQYLADFDYYRLQPINGPYNKWIDDKLTIKYILCPFNKFLPRYFYQLSSNRSGVVIHRLMDCPRELGSDVTDIIKLLEVEGCLAAKLAAGTRGDGFCKIAYREDQYYINEAHVTKNQLTEFLNSLDKYIICEYLFTHKDLAGIWAETPNSVRVLVIKEDGGQPRVAGSFIRFGTASSGAVDNICAGGIAATVDIDTGRFSKGRIYLNHAWKPSEIHPDTRVPIEGTLPFWDQIQAVIPAVCSYIPQMRFMGFDIIITDNGFKINEINSHPTIDLHNCWCPIYTDDNCKDFFIKLKQEKG